MFIIASEPHPDPMLFNSKIPECAVAVINKALAKDRTERYQDAGEMAEDLKACLKAQNIVIKDKPAKTNTTAASTPEPSYSDEIDIDPEGDVDFPI